MVKQIEIGHMAEHGPKEWSQDTQQVIPLYSLYYKGRPGKGRREKGYPGSSGPWGLREKGGWERFMTGSSTELIMLGTYVAATPPCNQVSAAWDKM